MYVYGVALQSSGDVGQAISVLERAHALHPSDRDILAALVDLERQRGDADASLRYARKLEQLR